MHAVSSFTDDPMKKQSKAIFMKIQKYKSFLLTNELGLLKENESVEKLKGSKLMELGGESRKTQSSVTRT